MKIRLTTSIASADWAYAPGQEIEMDAETAASWIESGIAVPVKEAEVETATAKQPKRETAVKRKGK